jgi:phosphatidylserine decarboxylase
LIHRPCETVDTTHWFRKLLHESTEHAGAEERSPTSAKQIKSFVEFYGIDMTQFTPSDIDAYKVRTQGVVGAL